MIKNKVPVYGEITDEQYTWWERGAQAEADAIREGITEDNRQIYDYVKVMAQHGYSADRMTSSVAHVFTCEWPLRKRLALAAEIVKPLKRSRQNPFRWLGNGLKDLWSATKAVPAKHWVLFVILLSVYVFSMYAMAWWLR